MDDSAATRVGAVRGFIKGLAVVELLLSAAVAGGVPASAASTAPQSEWVDLIGVEFDAHASDVNDSTEVPTEIGFPDSYHWYSSLSLWPGDGMGELPGMLMAVSPVEPGAAVARNEVIVEARHLDMEAEGLPSRVEGVFDVELAAAEVLSFAHIGCRDASDPERLIFGVMVNDPDAATVQQPRRAWTFDGEFREYPVDGVECELAGANEPLPIESSVPERVDAWDLRCFSVAGEPGDLAVVNLTPVRATEPGFGWLSSPDNDDTGVSNVNFDMGTFDPNLAVAPIGPDGQVCYRNGPASLQLVADQLATIVADAITPISPERSFAEAIGPGASRCFEVSGEPGDLAVVNLTPTNAVNPGFGWLSSPGADAAGTSNVNFQPGSFDPNVAVAEIGDDQQVCYRNGPAGVHVIADQLATINAESTATIAPARVLDTRVDAPVDRAASLCFEVSGEPGDMAVINLTPVEAAGPGYGALVSPGDDAGGTSNVNFDVGTFDPNVALAEIGADRRVCYRNGPTSVHVIADQLATLTADAMVSVTPERVLDTRVGTSIEFDTADAFGDFAADALAVTRDGSVVAADGTQVLLRDRDGEVSEITLPSGIDVSEIWVGADDIVVAWGDDRGVEIDPNARDERFVVSQLTMAGDEWTRAMTTPGGYRVQPMQPFNPLRLGQLTRTATEHPEVEGAGCFDVIHDADGTSWTHARPAECSAHLDEISPHVSGGYIVTYRAPEWVSHEIYPLALRPDGSIATLGSIDGVDDLQPGLDGLTILTVDGTTATVEHLQWDGLG